MRKLRMFFRIVLVAFFLPVFAYVLPQHDIARINGTEVIRQDFGAVNRWFYSQAESGNVDGETRDVLFINAVRKPTYLFGLIRGSAVNDVMVYRNEDTGWIWPPYFKFDSRDLQAEAQEYTSTAENPKYVMITHYGMRSQFFTIFPNAVSIKPITDPEMKIIPWFNIVFFVFLIGAVMFVRAMWFQFRERMLDPMVDRAGDKMDRMEAGVAERRSRMTRWLGTWSSRK